MFPRPNQFNAGYPFTSPVAPNNMGFFFNQNRPHTPLANQYPIPPLAQPFQFNNSTMITTFSSMSTSLLQTPQPNAPFTPGMPYPPIQQGLFSMNNGMTLNQMTAGVPSLVPRKPPSTLVSIPLNSGLDLLQPPNHQQLQQQTLLQALGKVNGGINGTHIPNQSANLLQAQNANIEKNPPLTGELHVDVGEKAGKEHRAEVSENSPNKNHEEGRPGEQENGVPSSELPLTYTSPISRAGNSTNENSPESIELVELDDDDDGDYGVGKTEMDMPKNWRMLMLFNGRVRDEDLPANCERPQTAVGKKYPFPECKCEFQEELELSDMEIEDESEKEQQQTPSTSAACTASPVAVVNELFPPKPPQPSYGYISKSGMTWIRARLDATVAYKQRQQFKKHYNTNSAASSPLHPTMLVSSSLGSPVSSSQTKPTEASSKTPTKTIVAADLSKKKNNTAQLTNGRPSTPQQQPSNFPIVKKHFSNRSLLILKNGKRLYAGSKECYQFVETGNCLNGIFCIFEHNGSSEHQRTRVCNRFCNFSFLKPLG